MRESRIRNPHWGARQVPPRRGNSASPPKRDHIQSLPPCWVTIRSTNPRNVSMALARLAGSWRFFSSSASSASMYRNANLYSLPGTISAHPSEADADIGSGMSSLTSTASEAWSTLRAYSATWPRAWP